MPNDSIVVSLLTCETSHDSAHTNKTWAEKLLIFMQAYKETVKVTTAQNAEIDATNEFSTILAVPEYFFTGKSTLRWPLNETDKATLEHKLCLLSGINDKILLVPGSVYYYKATNANRRQKAETRLNDRGMADLKRFGKEAFDYNFTDGRVGTNNATGLQVPSLVEKMEKVKTGPLNIGLLRNVAYLILGGQRVGKYDKQSDYHESLLSPDDMVFVPGTDKECPAIGQHRFGVEICFDHALGRLKKRGVDIDFHIVVSDYANNKEPHMAMGRFGYFLHASTEASQTKVYQRASDLSLQDLTNEPSKRCGSVPLYGGRLESFLLKLPKILKAEDLAQRQQKKSYRGATISPTGRKGF